MSAGIPEYRKPQNMVFIRVVPFLPAYRTSKLLRNSQMAVDQHQWDPILGVFGKFTTHFGTNFSGWIELDVHWGLTVVGFDPPD